MATTRIVYVNTASVGGDGTTNATSGANAAYANLNAALLANEGDLVTADEVLEIQCSGNADGVVIPSTSTDGYTTDATRFVRIRPAPGQEHGGAWNTGVYRYVMSATSGGIIFQIRNLVVDGLQIEYASTVNSNRNLMVCSGSFTDGDLDIRRCLFRVTGSTTANRTMLVLSATGQTRKVSNCVFYVPSGVTISGGTRRAINASGLTGNSIIHNCTIDANRLGVGIQVTNGVCVVRNTVAFGTSNDFLESAPGSFGSGCEFNVSGDTSAPGSNASVSQVLTDTFADIAANDYALVSGDTVLKDTGTTLTADATLPVTDDVIGTSRPKGAAFDVGAFEFDVGGVAFMPLLHGSTI